MITRTDIRLSAVLCAAAMWLTPAGASALPTCAELGTNPAYGLAGNPSLTSVSTTQVPATATVPTYCDVRLTQSTPGLSGPVAGYAEGQSQSIRMRFLLPEKSAWNGKLMGSAGSGSQGQVESLNAHFAAGIAFGVQMPLYAIQLGYIGSTNDAGHLANEEFGVIQATYSLNIGKLTDWGGRASTDTTRWAKTIAETYYGSPVTRSYWNGCSGGGLQGLTQMQQNGEEYDGFLIGAPPYGWARWVEARKWPPIVVKDMLTPLGKSLTAGQIAAANQAAKTACDGQADGVSDGVLADPRVCKFSAEANICGMPGAPASPNCLDADQAAAIDKIWDGPRNAKGVRVWFPWDRGVNFSVNAPLSPLSQNEAFPWARADLNFTWHNVTMQTYAEEMERISNAIGDVIENNDADLEGVKRRRGKIIWIHGTADIAIPVGASLDYYRRVAASRGGSPDYDALQPWFRLFLMPGLGHCFHGFGGVTSGFQAVDPFLALVDWVENDVAPDTILGAGFTGHTRPLCPYPQVAIYNGFGSTEDASNYHCGGNLETKEAVCWQLRAKYKKETLNTVDTFGRENPAACNEYSKVPMLK